MSKEVESCAARFMYANYTDKQKAPFNTAVFTVFSAAVAYAEIYLVKKIITNFLAGFSRSNKMEMSDELHLLKRCKKEGGKYC